MENAGKHSARSYLSHHKGFTLLELMVVIAVVAVLITIFMPHMCGMTLEALQSKSLSKAKEIAKACILFAAENEGKFPDGSYNEGNPGGVAGKKSGECFTDIIHDSQIKQEYFFWNPRAVHVCPTIKPHEDGKLEAGECAYDYISGMKNGAHGNLPLVFEACTTAGTKWDKRAGHPWDRKVIVANCDGSGHILATDKNYEIKAAHFVGKPKKEVKVDLVGAVSLAEGFPAGAFYAPAR